MGNLDLVAITAIATVVSSAAAVLQALAASRRAQSKANDKDGLIGVFIQALINWLPVGFGIGIAAHYALIPERGKAIAWLGITIVFYLMANVVTGFINVLAAELEKRGGALAQWLLDRADNLPGVLQSIFLPFERRYYQSLADEYQKLNVEGFNFGLPALNLAAVFVPLKIATEIPRNVTNAIPSNKKAIRIAAIESAQESPEIWGFLGKRGQMKGCRRLAIIAPPGSGKTTLLQHITLTYAKREYRKHKAQPLIPVLLRLRDVREELIKESPASLLELIKAEVENLKPRGNRKSSDQWFEKKLRQGQCLVMLDGLDEVSNDSERNRVSRWVKQQMKEYRRAYLS